jgi:hypothetical protein
MPSERRHLSLHGWLAGVETPVIQAHSFLTAGDAMDHHDPIEIAALISTSSICNDCLAYKTGLLARRVQTVLNQIAKSVNLMTAPGRCSRCLKQTVVHQLG